MTKRDDATDRKSALQSADPVRNFTLTTDERIRALTIGAPAWAVRKRRIEDEEDRLVAKLHALHEKLVASGHSAMEALAKLEAAASAYDLTKLNDLVARHNRYYPIEANLPYDRSGGGYLAYGRPWKPEEPYTAERLLARVRAEIEASS